MPNDTFHINASGNAILHVGDNYQSGDTQPTKLLNYLLPNWQLSSSLGLYWDHKQARKKHVHQTGEWMRELDEFQCWLFKPNSLLWLHGIAGCGKTVLSSTVIDYLRNSFSQGSTFTAGYYFNAREDEKRNVSRLIRSLLLQLVPTSGSLPPQVEKLCKAPSQNLSDDQLLLALEELVNRDGHTYIVIDALDECDASFRSGEDSEVDKLDEFLLWLFKKSRNLHLLATSRDRGLANRLEQRLRSMVHNGPSTSPPHHEIDLQSPKMETVINRDIGELVKSELKRWNEVRGRRWLPLSEVRADHVTTTVKRRANGMFRLAACLPDLLWRQDSWDALELAMDKLPSNLLDVYDRIFRDIDEQGQLETARTLLRWLLYSERPLSLEELTEVTMVDVQGASFNVHNRAEDESYVSQTLSSFVTISQDNLVQFAHQTVQEYLVSHNVQHGLFSRKVECHAWIARCCLTYMQFCAQRPDDPERNYSQIIGKRLPLFEYVSNNWYRHALGAWTNPGEGEALDGQVSSSSTASLRRCSLPISENDPECGDARVLLFQWAAAVKQWLDHMQAACTQDAAYSSTLRVVACQGYEKCIKVLLPDLTPTTPTGTDDRGLMLKAAVVGRYEEMIQIALNGFHKGDWNKASWWATTWDFLAESHVLKHESHKAIVQALLDHGVDVDDKGGPDGWTALHTAAFQGNEMIMELLLSYDADASVTDYDGRTALHVASSRGHNVIVQLLLKKGLPPDAKDNIGWTALDRAVQRAATELAVQTTFLSMAAQGESSPLESMRTLLDAEYSGTSATPQALQGNSNTVARTISLLLDATINEKAGDRETLRLTSREPTESTMARGIQFETVDDQSSINMIEPSTADEAVAIRETLHTITINEGHVKIGLSLMEELLQGRQLLTPQFAPPVNSPQLRRWLTQPTTTHVEDAFIHGGTVDFVRSRIRHVELNGGAANFTTSHVNNLVLRGGTANFLSAAELGNLVIYGGCITISSTAKLGNLRIYGGQINFLSAPDISRLTVHGGSLFSIHSIHREILRILLGDGVMGVEKSNAETRTTKTARVRDLAMYGGFVNLSSPLELKEATYHGGVVAIINADRLMCLLAGGGQDALARLLLDKGANPSEIWPGSGRLLLPGGWQMETSEWSALHEAALRGQEAFVRMLLEQKADLCMRDGNGPTPLEIAKHQGHTAIVRLLEEEQLRADGRNRAWREGLQKVLQKYAHGIHDALRLLTG